MTLVPAPSYGPGLLHAGFVTVADLLWERGLRQALDEQVVARPPGAVASLTVSGHSLGGAVTALLAMRAEVRADLAATIERIEADGKRVAEFDERDRARAEKIAALEAEVAAMRATKPKK
jgi:malonyl CoA-acyl carrier protein transacylase